MNATRLLEHFDRISDAADAVPRLRRFVLDLAVRGRIVAQDPTDLPFPIAASSGKVAQEPFPVPSAWHWIPFGAIHELVRGVTYTKSDVGEAADRKHVAILRANNIGTRINQDDLVYVNRRCVSENQMLREGDFLIALSSGSKNLVGKAALVDGPIDAAFGGFCGAIRLTYTDLHPFVRLFLSSPLYREAIASGSRGIGINNLKRSTLDAIPIPLPPLAEQHRIVAKVDELMDLCDRLEAAQVEREARRDRLVSASLARVTEPDADDATAAKAPARFHLDHFARLTTRPDHVKQLRQTILNLAVRGRLVPQDQAEEPADCQLQRLKAAKLAREATARGRKKTVASAEASASNPQSLPSGWTAAALADVVEVRNGRAYAKNELLDKGTPVLRVGNLFTSQHWYYSELALEDEKYCNEGDLLYAWSASFGPFIWPGPRAIFHYHIWNLVPHSPSDISKEYLYRFLQTETQKIKAEGHGISMLHMTKEKMERVMIPLPPLAEQRRIVARVDELMALCDRLEASLAEAATDRARLLEALLHEALAPAA